MFLKFGFDSTHSLLLSYLSLFLTESQPSLNLLCHSKTDAWFMQDAPKADWSIPYVSVAFFPSFKQNFIAYHSSEVSDCIFEIHQLWQSGFSRVYSNCCCSCSFEHEIIKIGQSSHKMYSNTTLNFQESKTTLNAHTKKSLETYRMPLMCINIFSINFTSIWIHFWKQPLTFQTLGFQEAHLVITSGG